MIVIPKKFQENLHYFEIQKGFGTTKLYSFSDVHFDNALCNRELFERHLKEAKKENGLMIFTGDFFCLMQGKYDPRSDKSALRTEHLGSGYLERVIDEAVEFMLPYAENILMFTLGNHETSVSNRIEINILKWFVEKLNSRAKTDI